MLYSERVKVMHLVVLEVNGAHQHLDGRRRVYTTVCFYGFHSRTPSNNDVTPVFVAAAVEGTVYEDPHFTGLSSSAASRKMARSIQTTYRSLFFARPCWKNHGYSFAQYGLRFCDVIVRQSP
ncbi:hypothetical protein E2C01_048692 [Portunus trituberculatus]|uniref:Uncharacterized protein n=1 Tax=Portunus trituberculatus TaxID=210409 RepID=A0A5B7GBN7_PORTR|nr:hypothetical protein [Portunus trituberculatus]